MRTIKLLITTALMVFTAWLLVVKSSRAAEAQPAAPSGQKKILVVFYSRTGNTKKVAQDIAQSLGADVEQLIDKKDRSGALGYMGAGKDASKEMLADIEPIKYDPAKYDLIVMGTPGLGMEHDARNTDLHNKQQIFI